LGSLRRPHVGIIGGLDVHRKQITFDYIDTQTGEVTTGKIRPATRERLRSWLCRFKGKQAAFALEATTGWRFVVEEIEAKGLEAKLAEPADTRALRGKKQRAKTDTLDARHLRELLHQERLPESWIPPSHIQDLRVLVRIRKNLVDERTCYLQRIHALLFHHGHPQERNLLSQDRRAHLEQMELPAAVRRSIELSLRMIDHINEELRPIEEEIRSFARRQVGCKALMGHYGVGELTSVAILAELGDTRRFSSSRHAVRYAGLDVTVESSDDKRAAGKLSRQGPPVLRWAAFEAAQCAFRKGSPDHDYYLESKDRLGGNRACLSIARKLIRRAHHTLRELGDEAFQGPVLSVR
jgi:transposase